MPLSTIQVLRPVDYDELPDVVEDSDEFLVTLATAEVVQARYESGEGFLYRGTSGEILHYRDIHQIRQLISVDASLIVGIIQ